MNKIGEELKSYKILDTEEEEFFNRITKFSSKITGCNISLIVFLEEHRQWFKSALGIDFRETPIAYSICKELIGSGLDILHIPDLSLDEYFKNHPAYGEFGIKFYAGAAIYSESNTLLGTVCVMDKEAKELDEFHLDFLRNQAELVKQMLELRKRNYQIESEKKALEVWRSFTERSAIIGGAGGFIINKQKKKLHWWPTNNVLFDLPEHVQVGFYDVREKIEGQSFNQVVDRFLTQIHNLIFVEESNSGEFLFFAKELSKVFRVTFREEEKLVLFFINDVTKHVHYEREISQQNQLIQKIEQVGNIGAWEYNLGENVITLTASFSKLLLFYPRQHITTADLKARFPAGSWDKLVHDMSTSIKDQEPFSNIYQYQTLNEQEKWLKVYAEPSIVNAEVVGFTGSGQDVTEDMHLLQVLKDKIRQIEEKNIYLDSLVNNQSFFIFKSDIEGNITFYNSFYEKIFVKPNENLIGKVALDMIVDEDRGLALDTVKKALANLGKTFKVKFRSKNNNDEVLVGIWDFSCQMYDDQKSSEVLCIGCDVTELEEKNASLQKLSRFTGFLNNKLVEFSNIISHNIRSQVSNLKGLMVLFGIADDESEKYHYIQLMNETVDNLDKLLHKIIETLAINSIENNRKERILLAQFINAILTESFPYLLTDEASLTVECDDDLLVYLNRTYIQSVLVKLITNAVEYKSKERKLALVIKARLKKENEKTFEIIIEDNGQGMDIDPDPSKLFRLYQTNHEILGSKGFSLFFVKNIVEFMGGSITIHSEKNIGTKIILELPYEYEENSVN